ncbi:hypothetical protein GMRT_14379 [Giardia muris]|uniref:Importin alpha subunit n=1 Tax=Giardia muris TaxID=5742 RepID=A0A4Z1T559_GIAMU|nr:hypothetical protein GMRT_14379 [Giardia muris]|eukprot:TNJ28227.1 hypothetical protein GMRT_14379 [Giardia muris]
MERRALLSDLRALHTSCHRESTHSTIGPGAQLHESSRDEAAAELGPTLTLFVETPAFNDAQGVDQHFRLIEAAGTLAERLRLRPYLEAFMLNTNAMQALIRHLTTPAPDIQYALLDVFLQVLEVLEPARQLLNAGFLDVLACMLGASNPGVRLVTLRCLAATTDNKAAGLNEIFRVGLLDSLTTFLVTGTSAEHMALAVYILGNVASQCETDEELGRFYPVLPLILNLLVAAPTTAIFLDCTWLLHFLTAEYQLSASKFFATSIVAQGIHGYLISRLSQFHSLTAEHLPVLYTLRNVLHDEGRCAAVLTESFIPFLKRIATTMNRRVREVAYAIIHLGTMYDVTTERLVASDVVPVVLQGLHSASGRILYNSVLIWGNIAVSPIAGFNFEDEAIEALNTALLKSIRSADYKSVCAILALIRTLINDATNDIIPCLEGHNFLPVFVDLTSSPDDAVATAAGSLIELLQERTGDIL